MNSIRYTNVGSSSSTVYLHTVAAVAKHNGTHTHTAHTRYTHTVHTPHTYCTHTARTRRTHLTHMWVGAVAQWIHTVAVVASTHRRTISTHKLAKTHTAQAHHSINTSAVVDKSNYITANINSYLTH